MINFIRKMIYDLYNRQIVNGEKYKHVPRSHWKNDYPIILVHGIAGYVPDSTRAFKNKNYFQFALEQNAAQRNLKISSHESQNIYIASLSPFGTIHERACELY